MNHNSLTDSSPVAIMDARIQAQLGRQLSTYYSELVKQPIPDTFLQLLKKLEHVEKGE